MCRRYRLGLSARDPERLEVLARRVEDVIVPAPSHVPQEFVDIRVAEEDDPHGRRVPTETRRPDRVLELTLAMPVTPAPAFDLEKNLETFRRLLALKPRALLF